MGSSSASMLLLCLPSEHWGVLPAFMLLKKSLQRTCPCYFPIAPRNSSGKFTSSADSPSARAEATYSPEKLSQGREFKNGSGDMLRTTQLAMLIVFWRGGT